jgi:hypothetical protein
MHSDDDGYTTRVVDLTADQQEPTKTTRDGTEYAPRVMCTVDGCQSYYLATQEYLDAKGIDRATWTCDAHDPRAS